MTKKIEPITGWLLISREEDEGAQKTGDWYIAWHDVFRTKKLALQFAGLNNWPRPFRAVRGQTMVSP